MFKFMGTEGIVGLDAYANANALVMETLSSIRTVVSFRGETRFAARYHAKLSEAQDSAIRSGISAAAGGASLLVRK